MNQSIQRGTARRAHVLATHTVAPISRAVRAALTVSAAMLSLCVPVAGWAAGATSQDVPGHACALNGTFGQHAPEASFVLPVDLTVVAGEQLPTSVYPDAGLVGIDGSWAAGASGIVTAGGGAGVVHDVTVVDDADALAGGVDGVYAALTTDVLSTAGDIGIGNLDEVNLGARTYDGSAAALAASARGDYSQLHTGIEGVINADSVNGDANGIVASAVSHGFANVQNSTDINVSGYGTVTGLDAFDTNDSTVDNSAAITVHAYAGAGEAAAYGVRNGSNQRAYFNNTGEIGATAVSDTGVANAIGVLTGGFYSSDATNAGDISAMATGGQATAIGLVNESYFDATTTNAGSITVSADGTLAPYGQFEAVATGIYTFAANGNAVLNNSGSVSVVASATAQIESSAGFLVAKAIGVRAVSPSGYGGALIDNSGDISASAVTGQGYASAWGAIAQSDSNDVGNAQIDNDGSISSSAISGAGNSVTIGAYAHSGSTSIIVNHGDINATSRAERGIPDVSLATSYATGAQVYGYAYGGGEVNISNYGTIKAAASIEGGIAQATALKTFGSTSTVDNAEGATILATTRADLFGGAHSIAVEAGGVYNVDVVNNGSIAAYGYAHAYSVGEHGYYGASGAVGVEATANYRGNVSVVNHGDISAHAVADHSISWGQGGAAATGVNTYAKYTAFVENSSTISAVAEAEFGNVGSYGVMGRGKYYTHIINDAGAT
ncbi:MAG: hypothetical protein ABI129_09085, partial [Rhodanobacter sp.]